METDQAASHVELCRQSLKSELEVRKRAVQGKPTWKRLTVTLPNCILRWAASKMQLFLSEQHRRTVISLWRRGGSALLPTPSGYNLARNPASPSFSVSRQGCSSIGAELTGCSLFAVYGLLAHQGVFLGAMSAILSEDFPYFTEPVFVLGRSSYELAGPQNMNAQR